MPDPCPPFTVELKLPCPAQRAWQAFVHDFADWWPVVTHSLSRDPRARCVLEATPGGAVFELAPDGARHDWGRVTECDETVYRLMFTWHPGRETDSAQWVQVEVHSTEDGCLLSLTHGGWEALGEIAPLLRQEYRRGWRQVLDGALQPWLMARLAH
ncbi:MAG: SRPBCC domain-containing protein [Steroidobacteraceae bacterium]